MDNKIIIQEIKGLLKSLKGKNISSLQLGMDTRRQLIIGELEKELAAVPKGMTNALKEQRLTINALITPINDLFNLVEEDDLLVGEMVQYYELLTKHLQNYKDFEPPAEKVEGEEEAKESIFTRANIDFTDDARILGREQRGKKAVRCLAVKRAVAAHFDTILSDFDYNRTSLPAYRVEDGYAVIPNQRVVCLDISSLKRGANQYEAVKQWLTKEYRYPERWKVVEFPCSVEKQGLSYWWVMRMDDFEIIFEEREMNAWCPVNLGAK